MDIEDLSVNEVIDIIMETPRILKSPILVDDKRLQVGYKEDDIRAFLPRSVRNVEMQQRMRAALKRMKIRNNCFWFFLLKNGMKRSLLRHFTKSMIQYFRKQ